MGKLSGHDAEDPCTMIREEDFLQPIRFIPLNIHGRNHKASAETVRLLHAVGGLPALRRFTTCFYKKFFADTHLDKFVNSHSDPHGERFATWVAERMGHGSPWSDAARTRRRRSMLVNGHTMEVAHDRSSSHFAAWHCPKREPHLRGQRFKLQDARIWMRLHFWAAREAGLFDNEAWMDYYVRFIGHFIDIYSNVSVPFTRESARWSANPSNTEEYVAAGNTMIDVLGQSQEEAFAMLPSDERPYDRTYPYYEWPRELSNGSGLPVGNGRRSTFTPPGGDF